MSPRVRNPSADPIVARLGKPRSRPETEDVIALIGFVGPGREGHKRLYSDRNLQRWLEIPRGDIVDSHRVDPADELSRTVVWVQRSAMVEPMFKESVFGKLDAEFTGGWMSTWPLIPDTRYVAAQILDLLADAAEVEEAYS